MPVESETNHMNKQSSDFTRVKLFKPAPDTTNAQFTNELFIPLYQPDAWRIFNYSPETAEKLGLYPGNPLAPVAGQSTIYTFYFNVPVHGIQKYVRPDGSEGFASVVCPTKFNDYLTSGLQRRPMFANPRCAHCEAAQAAWGEHNKRWAQIKAEKGIDRKSLVKEAYNNMIANDPILKETRDKARGLESQDRYWMITFDHSKVTGAKKLDEGETSVEYLPWMAPKGVVDTLKMFFTTAHQQGMNPFFSFDNPQGFQIMNVNKAVGRDKRQDTKYTAFPGGFYNYDANYRSYLTNIAAMPDPSDYMLVLSYEEMKSYLPSNEPINAPLNGTNVGYNGGQNMPQMMMQAPVAPQMATPNFISPNPYPQMPQAPVAQAPVMAAPSVPVAPVAPPAFAASNMPPVYAPPTPSMAPQAPVMPMPAPTMQQPMAPVPMAPTHVAPTVQAAPTFAPPIPPNMMGAQVPSPSVAASMPQVPTFVSPSPIVPSFAPSNAPDRTPPSDDSGDTSW